LINISVILVYYNDIEVLVLSIAIDFHCGFSLFTCLATALITII